jgi:hypothetical protein
MFKVQGASEREKQNQHFLIKRKIITHTHGHEDRRKQNDEQTLG